MILLALDLDGTVVLGQEPLSDSMKELFECAHRDDCLLLFVTGRTTKWALQTLNVLSVPFFLGSYNGALTIKYPEGMVTRRVLLERSDIEKIFPYIKEYGAVLYECGEQERVFYTSFPQEFSSHVAMRQAVQKEEWICISAPEELPEEVATVRFFVSEENAKELSFLIESQTQLSAPTMEDAFDSAVSIVQVTASGASKGEAVRALRQENPKVHIIAAGNDVNDITLLREADVAIATPDAPLAVREIAHVIAPGAADLLLEPLKRFLKEAIQREKR